MMSEFVQGYLVVANAVGCGGALCAIVCGVLLLRASVAIIRDMRAKE